MKKDKFNTIFREYVKNNISPTEEDRAFVSTVYESFKTTLNKNCIQIGSYPRFTAIRPLHDLDILYIIGNWNEENHNPIEVLKLLEKKIIEEYENPTEYSIDISLQSHSITIVFNNDEEEVFSVDIVPAYIVSKNEFGDDTYKVPEVLRKKHGKKRAGYYQELIDNNSEMGWVTSDPRGYITVATSLNNNNDFRRAVKFVKSWKNSHKENDDNFKLKSFHIEQVITKYFQEDTNLEIFDGIFKFFVNLPQIIEQSQVNDRADNDEYIDEYIDDLTEEQKENIIEARDCFLIQLEDFDENSSVEDLLEANFYTRPGNSEEFLFDSNIKTFIEDELIFKIKGEVQERTGSFRKYILDRIGLIVTDRKIKFTINSSRPNVDLFKWKVRNDAFSPEPRGEITDHKTKNDPEHSKYSGNHYVECYAILDNVCVAKAKQCVRLD